MTIENPPLRVMNFASDKGAPDAFEFAHVTCVATGESLYLKPHAVPVYNLRHERHKPSIDSNGYTWEHLPYQGLEEYEGWEDRYAEATCECVLSVP